MDKDTMYKQKMTPEGNAPNKMMDYKNTRSKRANYAIKELAKRRKENKKDK